MIDTLFPGTRVRLRGAFVFVLATDRATVAGPGHDIGSVRVLLDRRATLPGGQTLGEVEVGAGQCEIVS